MTNAETIWNVISWYYGNSTAIGLMLVLMTVYLLGRKKNIDIIHSVVQFLCFDFKSVNLPHYRAIGRGRYVLSLFMDIPGLIDCRMGGLRLIEKMKSKMEKLSVLQLWFV